MSIAIVCRSFFLLIVLATATQIQPSIGHNNAFVQDESEIQYLLDNLPISMHQGFPDAIHSKKDSRSLEDEMEDFISHIKFEPGILDFKERQLGVPHQETVTLFNCDDNRTIHLSSISGNTRHFHSSFFQDKIIPPHGNTTFNVVFLGREEGQINSYLFIHTSEGTLKYHVKGISVTSPYRLRPVVGIKLPVNVSFSPLIYMHNPHSETMQVVEVYSSGREFQLELPSGEVEGPRELWEIPPYQTKPVIRLQFNAHIEKNHTAYIRFRVNNSAEILIVAVEIEVSSGAGLHWGDSSGAVNFGIGGSMQPPTQYQLLLKNSARRPVRVQNIVSTPATNALKIDFKPTVIPGDTYNAMPVGTLTYNWKAGLQSKHFKGKLMIKGYGPGGSSQKLTIPWVAEVVRGGLEVNRTATHYCSPHNLQPRHVSIVNKYEIPLAITNVSLAAGAIKYFTVSDFVPKILGSGQRDDIFTLSLVRNNLNTNNLLLKSALLIHSNVSTTEVPLYIYNGKLQRVIPGERGDKATMNFGTVSSGTETESTFALQNSNPVNVDLHGWGVNMPGAVLELMGCQDGPSELFQKGIQIIAPCSFTGNQSVKSGSLAVFKIKVKTPFVEEDTVVGDVFIKTSYERLIIPVYMRVSHGKLSVSKLAFADCFPGTLCLQQINIQSTFARSMKVNSITPSQGDDRLRYVPVKENSPAKIAKGDNHVGALVFDPSRGCRPNCYLGIPANTSAESQWLNTFNLPSRTRDTDLALLIARYALYGNSTKSGPGSWENIGMTLDTTEVRSHKFLVSVKLQWPGILQGLGKNRTLTFPLTQVGNTTYKFVSLHNPTDSPLVAHLVMDWAYPQGAKLFQSLPDRFKVPCKECPAPISGEFRVDDFLEDKKFFTKEWSMLSAPQTLPLIIGPNETKTVRFSYTPTTAAFSTGLLYLRNNMTILEVMRFVGRGAHAQLKFGNRKPGSQMPLLFEITEKHLGDCDNKQSAANPNTLPPAFTVKRSFLARNTGEVPIDVTGFWINRSPCEGHGFRVLNCEAFTLEPNGTRKIEIGFTPDFTLSRVEHDLFIKTSLQASENTIVEDDKGTVKFSLLTTLPAHMLKSCAQTIARPAWEVMLHWGGFGLTVTLLVCLLTSAFLEADRILRDAMVSMSKGSPTQPTLDLRLLTKEKPISVSSNNNKTVKVDTSPNWSLMNIKRGSNSKGLRIPDWSAEDERRFKLDTESKNLENSNVKKRSTNGTSNGKKISNTTEASNKSSPGSGKKKDKTKDEPQVTDQPKGGKKKAATLAVAANEKSSVGQTTSQKVTNFSEEETSSTTTESSVQEDTFKYCDSTCDKLVMRSPKKTEVKVKQLPSGGRVTSSIDYKDNYEGDCDEDDEYSKDDVLSSGTIKRSSVSQRSGASGMLSARTANAELAAQKTTRQKLTPPRKEKVKKSKSSEKLQIKAPHLTNGNLCAQQREDQFSRSHQQPQPQTPPSLYWGENRARFSDVVARNQDNSSPFNNGKLPKNGNLGDIYPVSPTCVDNTEQLRQNLVRDILCDQLSKYDLHQAKKNHFDPSDLFGTSRNQSLFANSFVDQQPFEPDLVPFDDLPETSEPLVELEPPAKTLWQGNNALPVSMQDNSTKDVWANTWEPLHNRGAVGDERNGVWGLSSGNIWAPWGAPPQAPVHPPGLLPAVKASAQDQSGFDPFRSLSTIWTPSSCDVLQQASSKPKQ